MKVTGIPPFHYNGELVSTSKWQINVPYSFLGPVYKSRFCRTNLIVELSSTKVRQRQMSEQKFWLRFGRAKFADKLCCTTDATRLWHGSDSNAVLVKCVELNS